MTKDWDSFQYEAYQNGCPIILIMIPICIDDSTLGVRNLSRPLLQDNLALTVHLFTNMSNWSYIFQCLFGEFSCKFYLPLDIFPLCPGVLLWRPMDSGIVGLFSLLCIAFQVVMYVVTRPGRELLFTVVSQDEKYKAKVTSI